MARVVGIGLMTLVLGLAFAGVGITIGGLTVPVPARRRRVARVPALGT